MQNIARQMAFDEDRLWPILRLRRGGIGRSAGAVNARVTAVVDEFIETDETAVGRCGSAGMVEAASTYTASTAAAAAGTRGLRQAFQGPVGIVDAATQPPPKPNEALNPIILHGIYRAAVEMDEADLFEIAG